MSKSLVKKNFPRIIMILMWCIPIVWCFWRYEFGRTLIVGMVSIFIVVALLALLIVYSYCVIKYNSFNPDKHKEYDDWGVIEVRVYEDSDELVE